MGRYLNDVRTDRLRECVTRGGSKIPKILRTVDSGHGDTAGCPNSLQPVPSTSRVGVIRRGISKFTNSKANKPTVKELYAKGIVVQDQEKETQGARGGSKC